MNDARTHDPIVHSRCGWFAHSHKPTNEVNTRADLYTSPSIRFSRIRCSVCVCLFIYAIPIRGWFVLFRFLVCRRPINQAFSFIFISCAWLFAVCIESALTLSLLNAYAHMAVAAAHTQRSTRSFCCTLFVMNCWIHFVRYGCFIAVLSNAEFHMFSFDFVCCNAGMEYP